MPISAGDLVFVAFSRSKEENRGFAFVVLAPLTAGTAIAFTNQDWNGVAFARPDVSLTWTVPAGGIASGTLVQLTTNTTPSANLGTVALSASAIAVTCDNRIYAISGTPACPGTFIAAINITSAEIDGTGLVYGHTALDLRSAANANALHISDVACINPTVAGSTYANPVAVRDAYHNAANWLFDDNYVLYWPELIDRQSTLSALRVIPAAFLPGTLIRTPNGETAIDKLAIGDQVVTADGSAKPVKFVGRFSTVTMFSDKQVALPVMIKVGALGANTPARDLCISPGQVMLIDGLLAMAGALVNGGSIVRREHVPWVLKYFHIELDEQNIVFAEGAPTTTYCETVSREFFDNAAEYQLLYPKSQPMKELDLPTIKSARQLPLSIRRSLEQCAIGIGAVLECEAVSA